MEIKNTFKLFLLCSLTLGLFYSCKKEFEYKKSKNAVKTLEVLNVSQTGATVAGNVITDNGARLTARGICYKTTKNPTITDSISVANDATLGEFSCILSNLFPGKVYYARAYATNSFGTAYGTEVSFTTLPATVPILSATTPANTITPVSAKSGGTIIHSGATSVTSRGVCYSNINTVPTISDLKTNDGTGTGTFTSLLNGLTANTTYYIRAYATNSLGTGYGDVKEFSTANATIPNGITTNAISSITQVSAIGGGSISSDGGAAITARGICWSTTTTTPTILDSKTNDGNGAGSFVSTLTGLTSSTTYYVRAYATNSVGTAYGNLIAFNTASITAPTGITTTTFASITQISATSGGTISSDGGAPVTSRGVCWSNTTTSPTILNSKTIDGNGIGSFLSSLTGLLPGSTYYVRAYATNSAGTAYGNVLTLNTLPATIPVGVTTRTITSIAQTSASSGGNIVSDGGAPVSSRGVCWSNTTSSPTITNLRTLNGSGVGSFTSSLSGLTANTTYYVRAYATNSVGTAYGNTLTFTTSPSLFVGQSYQGGVIAYIFTIGDVGYVAGEIHGLIATTSNQSIGAQWGCSGTSVTGTSTTLGSGLANTTAIVNRCNTVNIAAALCNNLVIGGYSDWYLPSRDELNKLYLNKTAIGGLNSASYWSSSQTNSTTAWSINFSSGTMTSSSPKTNLNYVRAIRKF